MLGGAQVISLCSAIHLVEVDGEVTVRAAGYGRTVCDTLLPVNADVTHVICIRVAGGYAHQPEFGGCR